MTNVKNRSKSNSSPKIKEEDIKKTNENLSSKKNITLRVLSRSVVIISLLIVVYFSSKNEKLITFARQSDTLTGKGIVVECSADYLKEVHKYEGCTPRDCKRFVTDKVVSEREAEELLQIAKKGLKHGGSSGGASILDLHSGALSQGQQFVNIYKLSNMKDVFNQKDFNTFRVVKDKIKYAIAHYFEVNPNKIYLTHPTFFSEITSKKAITIHDEYWHPHVDKETYKSFHYTSLLYLSNYNLDFKGGRFVFIDGNQNSTIEPKKARLSAFTSGGENLHYVEKVSSGVRYAITISFTCDRQYAIEDPSIEKYNIIQ